jgi:hypothetical protein
MEWYLRLLRGVCPSISRYRKSLYLLAIAIPATLHGLYDSFAGVFYMVSLMIALGNVLALMTYLSKSNNFRERLKG